MSNGKSFKEIFDSLDEDQIESIFETLRDMGFIDCPNCNKWFIKKDYCENKEKSGSCEAHIQLCNLVLWKMENIMFVMKK